ncbi:MAG: isoprenylcysteine carboxylmethyltransferase family protein [Ignavibacteriaceae bacterium]|jgi:protein-S-isoprenylcysteine O-methyltransferase Ste14|nr:isoprenylcysteine carboxylmethyltransferase family protein [Ignavibacteriaceae bacterium]
MDPINIIVALNIIATFGANVATAKKGFRSVITSYKEKPKSWLQNVPVYFTVITLVALILGVFRLGVIEYKPEFITFRSVGLILYIIFSWVQIWSFKSLGEFYSQEILIYKNHDLISKGPYKFLRHPQYLAQMLVDLGGGIAVMSYLLLPVAIIEIPFLIMRALLEEKLLEKNFKERFAEYKKKTGFLIPFIG